MSIITALSDRQLAKYAQNPLTADEANAEIARRKEVAINFAQLAEAEARKVLEGFTFASLSTEQLAIVVRLLKPAAPKGGITKDVVPQSYLQVREAIKVICAAEGVKINWGASDN